MTAHLSEEHISAWVDGQLEAEERRLLEAHLPGCEKCRTIFEEMSEVVRLFRHEELTPSPELWRRISTKLDSPRGGSRHWRLPSGQKEIGAAAAAILLMVAGSVWLFLRHRSEDDFRRMAFQELDGVHAILTTRHSESYNPFSTSSTTDSNSNPFSSGRLSEGPNPFRTLARQ
jgi:putative zinc finger protein